MKSLSQQIESFRIAFAALKANKTRGILTTLGIIIGIVAVATTMTAANGLANNFKESISAIGSDVLYVSRMPWIITGNYFEYRNRPNLTLKDSEKLKHRLFAASAINPTTNTNKNIKYLSEVIESVPIIGTTDIHIKVTDGLPEYGRFLIPVDVQFRKRVCVIGSEIREKLFKHKWVSPSQLIKGGRACFLLSYI